MTARRRGITAGLGLALVVAVAPAAAADPDAGAVELSVAGAPESTTLFGDVLVVPGRSETQSLAVTNVGDLAGTLTIEVVDVALTGAPDAFFDDITVNGIPAATLDGAETPITADRTLRPGEVITVPVTLAFDVTDMQADPGRTFTFAVRATLTGESQGVGESPDVGGPLNIGGPRAQTGGILAMNHVGLLWAAGALVTGGFVALIPVLRRRRRGRSV